MSAPERNLLDSPKFILPLLTSQITSIRWKEASRNLVRKSLLTQVWSNQEKVLQIGYRITKKHFQKKEGKSLEELVHPEESEKAKDLWNKLGIDKLPVRRIDQSGF